jgi:hypothetical protein
MGFVPGIWLARERADGTMSLRTLDARPKAGPLQPPHER